MRPLKRNLLGLLEIPLIALLAVSCGPDRNRYTGKTISTFRELRKEFREPSKEYGTVPFFVWNGRITKPEINSFMLDVKRIGSGGVFIHARPGLITPYLREEWFDLFRYALGKGKELGIDVWIYDEYNFPSGFAGGNVPAQMPGSYKQGQGIQMKKYEVLPDSIPDGFLVLREDDGRQTEITDLEAEKGKKATYRVFTKAWYDKGDNDYYFHGNWYGGFTYVDLLVKGVTEKFIQVTMDGYEKAVGDELGKAMPGIFTDEPHLNSPGGIRWTPDLFDAFQKQWGYDLRIDLPSLFEETGDWKKVRHNYAQTLLDLFIDRWAKPYFEYCERKGLVLTGHYWEHAWPSSRLGPDNMAMYPWMQIPGVDMLFNQFDETSTSAQFGNVRAVKELSSVANQLGLPRTLCETYGGGGWDLTFADMKRLGDWEYALGINMMNQHMSPITEEGCRKYDHPPHFTYNEPWFRDYGGINRYFGRLSAALASGKQVNDILVIEPTTSAWMYDSYAKPVPRTQQIGNSFQGFVTSLVKSQVEFEIGSENIIRGHGRAENGRFVIGQRSYSAVIIPPMTENLNSTTVKMLEDYAVQGGKLFLYSVPERMDGSRDARLAEFLSRRSDNIQVIGEALPSSFARFADNSAVRFGAITGGSLYHHRRILDDGQLLFLVNSSLDSAAEGTVSLSGVDAVRLDAFTGEVAKYPVVEEGERRIGIAFNLPPAGSLLLYTAGSRIDGMAGPPKQAEWAPIEPASPLTVARDKDNVLMMDFCDLFLAGQTTADMQVLDAGDKVYRHHGFEQGNPWTTYVQYDNNLMGRDTFGPGTGYTATYRFRIEGAFDVSGMKAVVEHPDICRVSVNGTEAQRISGEWWLDRHFGVFGIGSLVRPGNNELAITVSPMKLVAEIEPAYITGDFSVIPADKGWTITAPPGTYGPGSWKTQGAPFYPYDFSYTRTFDVQDVDGRYEIGLGTWNGTVAEVAVNGQPAGIIGYPPYRLDVTSLISKGGNRITVTVIGSLKNLLGPHHNHPPKGIAISPYWRNVKAYPPGREYEILDYGLIDDFLLLRGK